MALVLDHLVILASDLPRSVRWYDSMFAALGMDKTREHVWASGNGCVIDLRPATDDGQAYSRHAPGLNHIGFTAENCDAVDAIASEMAAAGFEVPDGQTFPDGYAIFFRDPDGMRVEVGCYCPG